MSYIWVCRTFDGQIYTRKTLWIGEKLYSRCPPPPPPPPKSSNVIDQNKSKENVTLNLKVNDLEL